MDDRNLETVCGSEIGDPKRHPSDFYREERVYFCTRACLEAFREQPDRFIAGEIEHPDGDG